MAMSFTDAFGKHAKLHRSSYHGDMASPFFIDTRGSYTFDSVAMPGAQDGEQEVVTKFERNGPDAGVWRYNEAAKSFDFYPGDTGNSTKSVSAADLGLSQNPAFEIAGLASLAGKNGDSWSNYALTHNDYGGGVGSAESMMRGAAALQHAIGDITGYENKKGLGEKALDFLAEKGWMVPLAVAGAGAFGPGGAFAGAAEGAGTATGTATGTAAGGTGAGTFTGVGGAGTGSSGIGLMGNTAVPGIGVGGAAGSTLTPSLFTAGELASTFPGAFTAADIAGSGIIPALETANDVRTATSLTDKVLNKIKDDPLGTLGKAATLGIGVKAATDLNQTGVSADESNLQSAQAKWLNNLNAIATPALRTGMSGLSKMTTQAMDGTLGAQMRDQAGKDANAAIGASGNDALRTLSSRGIGLDGSRAMDTLGKWGIDAAKVRSGAMNNATANAENMKWNRAQGLTSLASGQGATANSGMSALVGQLSANRNAENAANANAQMGMGQGLMYLAGKMFADGGEVIDGEAPRVDMTPGGPVEGHGTETSDSIPAALSDGEFVNNAEAVKMPRDVTQGLVRNWLKSKGTTKDLLHTINDEGLRRRGDRPAESAAIYGTRGEQQLAGGGLAMALGNMARGAVPVAMQMEQQAESARRWEAENARAQAVAERDAERFGLAKDDRAKGEAKKQAVADVMAKYQPLLAATGGDPRKALEVRQQQYAELSAIDPAYAAQVDNMLTTQLNTSLKDRDFTRQEGRDTVADQQWGQSFGQKDRQFNASHQVSLGNLNLSREKLSAEKADRDAKTAAALEVFSEHNPNASPAVLNAVKHGIIPAVPKSDDGAYKTEFSEVSSALGSPAVGEDGKPLLDVMTGRQVVNRNPEEERQFFAWAQQRGIKDTNKALPIYLAEKARNQPKSFSSPADLEAAIKSGAVKPGDKVMTPKGALTVK